MDFRDAGGKRAAAELKQATISRVERNHFLGHWLAPKIEGSPYYMDFLESIHPKIASYTPAQLNKAYDKLVGTHPKLLAEMAKKRNRLYGIPNYPTSSRIMKQTEQKFLSDAMQLIKDDVAKKPFHMHGESGAVGDKNGDIPELIHNSGDSVGLTVRRGDKYSMHSHPPFGKPFDFSASEADHRVAAETYLDFNNKMNEYLTNGKEVLHIQPDSLELVKLHPNPKWEKKFGKFPEAFRLPDPQPPPRPFANHEAPAAFEKNWQPPPGWNPPQDYPGARAVQIDGGPSASRKRPASPVLPELSKPAKSARPSESSHT